MQPAWFVKDPFFYAAFVPLVGEDRAAHSFPMKTWFDQRQIAASSTDWPITPLNPLDGIAAGVMRWQPSTCSPGDVLWPEQAVSVDQMIRSYTVEGAKATFVERQTGSIAIGKSADMVVLSRNIVDCPPEQIFDQCADPSIGSTHTLMTLFQGQTVFESPDRDDYRGVKE